MHISTSLPRHSQPPVARPGQLLVRMREHDDVRLGQLCQEHDLTLMRQFTMPVSPERPRPSPPLLQVAVDPSETDEALSRLQADPRVAYAEPNYLVYELARPNDLDERLYGLEAMHCPQAWDQVQGERQHGPVIAVLDSGCDYTHFDLAENIWRNPGEIPANGLDDDGNGVVDDVHGFNAAARSGDPMDDGSHGTHVCGTLGAVGNNGQGVVGVNWRAQIMPVKFLAQGFGDTADAIEGLLYATRQGARITSNSWGGIHYSQALRDVLAESPALHLCAAGNDASNNDVKPVYPAGYQLPNVLAVAASDATDQPARFSNYGATSVHLAAPGDKILSTTPAGQLGVKSGTSMATPHASGLAALIATHYPGISNQQLKDRLLYGVDRLPAWQGKIFSGGRLNAVKALEDDRLAPGAVGALGASATPFQVDLTWTAPGDDALDGQASAYEIYSSDEPLCAENLERARALGREMPPQPSGNSETFSLTVQPRADERSLYVGVRAVDNVGNRGPLVTRAVQVPGTPVAFDGQAWQAGGNWGQMEVPGRGMVWTDSPKGPYQEGEDSSLTSEPFSLRDYRQARLDFECRYDLEKIFDSVTLEVSRGGDSWQPLDRYEGLTGWEKRSYDLTPFCGESAERVQLRFRLKTDLDVCQDGFSLDQLVVTGQLNCGPDPAPAP